MAQWNIESILEKIYQEGHGRIVLDIGSVRSSLDDKLGALNWNFSRIAVISDDVTHKILASDVAQSARRVFLDVDDIVLPSDGLPSMEMITSLRERCQDVEGFIAVGSGTVGDIVKYISYLSHKPYVIFATALSMNGYASMSASVIDCGYRVTKAAHLPRAIFMDIDVLAESPKRLIMSGVGDSLCRSTAQLDWLLSHYVMGTQYRSEPFEWLQPFESKLFNQDGLTRLMQADEQSIELLAYLLILSGLGMTLCGGSYPASQGEHMIAHTMNMATQRSSRYYHGEDIAVTTLVMADIQSQLLEQPWGELLNRVRADTQENITSDLEVMFENQMLVKQAQCEYELKYSNWNQLQQNSIVDYDVKKKLRRYQIDADVIRGYLEVVESPMICTQIEWSHKQFQCAVRCASLTRRRFTFLDLYRAQMMTEK